MSWLEPPPLAEKRDVRKELPPGLNVKRMRMIVISTAATGAFVVLGLAVVVMLVFQSTLGTYWLPISLISIGLGAGIGVFLALRALRAVLVYGMSMNKQPPV